MTKMDDTRPRLHWTPAGVLPDNTHGAGCNRRGCYCTLGEGLSFGGGQGVRSALMMFYRQLLMTPFRFLAASRTRMPTFRLSASW